MPKSDRNSRLGCGLWKANEKQLFFPRARTTLAESQGRALRHASPYFKLFFKHNHRKTIKYRENRPRSVVLARLCAPLFKFANNKKKWNNQIKSDNAKLKRIVFGGRCDLESFQYCNMYSVSVRFDLWLVNAHLAVFHKLFRNVCNCLIFYEYVWGGISLNIVSSYILVDEMFVSVFALCLCVSIVPRHTIKF